MIEYILLVTWFFGDRPMDSYQVTFGSLAACRNAQVLLQKEEERLRAIAAGSVVVPILSSVCAAK